MDNIAIIILAAGESSRMSGSKQLLKYKGQTLLRKSVFTALSLNHPVITVLGAGFELHKKEIIDLNTAIVFNKNWQLGMGSSLKLGVLTAMETCPTLDALIVMVCDQPAVDAKLLTGLIEGYGKGNPIVASSYQGTLGVPALFDASNFSALLKLPNEKGAKALIKSNATFSINFPKGELDIDTMEDYERLKNDN